MDSCDSPAALQEHFDRELQRQTVAHGNQQDATESDGSAGANGESEVSGEGSVGDSAGERGEKVRKAPTPQQSQSWLFLIAVIASAK